MGKITKLREIGQILKWMRGWVRQDHHPFGGRDYSILHSHIVEAQHRVEQLIAEEKKGRGIIYCGIPRSFGKSFIYDEWMKNRTEGKDEEKKPDEIFRKTWDDMYSKHMYDALRYDRYETGVGIADIRQFAEKRAEQSRNQKLPHFKRAEIVFEKYVPEGTSMKKYRFKKFINIATERELPIRYKKYPPHFYANKDATFLCLKLDKGEYWYSCGEFGDEMTEREYETFMCEIKLAGERLHRIMEKERELANHKGEERVIV